MTQTTCDLITLRKSQKLINKKTLIRLKVDMAKWAKIC